MVSKKPSTKKVVSANINELMGQAKGKQSKPPAKAAAPKPTAKAKRK